MGPSKRALGSLLAVPRLRYFARDRAPKDRQPPNVAANKAGDSILGQPHAFAREANIRPAQSRQKNWFGEGATVRDAQADVPSA